MNKITVKKFREMLENHDDDLELDFNGLEFYRLKDRGGSVQVEFIQTVYKDDKGKVVIKNHY